MFLFLDKRISNVNHGLTNNVIYLEINYWNLFTLTGIVKVKINKTGWKQMA